MYVGDLLMYPKIAHKSGLLNSFRSVMVLQLSFLLNPNLSAPETVNS